MIIPNVTEFRLHVPGVIPLVTDGKGQLQPLRAPSNTSGPEDIPEDLLGKGDPFSFHKPKDAPAGLYDLVVTGLGSEPQYVAKAANGDLVLTTVSTGPTAQKIPEHEQPCATSIFTVDCDGHVGVTHEGSPYSWNTHADGKGTSFTPGADIGTMLALDFAPFDITENNHERRSVHAKRDTFRCSPGLRGVSKPGARPPSANGCGSRSTHKLVPELYFHDCCDSHDVCYDECAQQSCYVCNHKFYLCMNARCVGVHSYLKRELCHVAAHLYFTAVQGKFGCPFFAQYTLERCTCIGPSERCYSHPTECPP
ncbi:hypothetical protein EJ03DRAFT_269125 [Teratosphaeria nubilosa]|uniref:Phospholipase A2 domain-containing protein n=1 Tax=Teratosphaeria nubilosa TaxID=161662 RepID=A0A6G1LDY6_9PEZI|nr:hypothetical protein EJ03DRAFT_269125 [Teratosphaeria nubilosa]